MIAFLRYGLQVGSFPGLYVDLSTETSRCEVNEWWNALEGACGRFVDDILTTGLILLPVSLGAFFDNDNTSKYKQECAVCPTRNNQVLLKVSVFFTKYCILSTYAD